MKTIDLIKQCIRSQSDEDIEGILSGFATNVIVELFKDREKTSLYTYAKKQLPQYLATQVQSCIVSDLCRKELNTDLPEKAVDAIETTRKNFEEEKASIEGLGKIFGDITKDIDTLSVYRKENN